MGQVLVFERNGADGIGIRDFFFVGISFRPRFAVYRIGDDARALPPFGTITGFRRNGFRFLILPAKEHFQCSIHIVNRPLFTAVIRRNDGNQRMGIMPDVLRLHDVLVMTGVIARIMLHLILQFLFHLPISAFHRFDVRFFRRVRSHHKGLHPCFQKRSA